jgi:hypothetical protein
MKIKVQRKKKKSTFAAHYTIIHQIIFYSMENTNQEKTNMTSAIVTFFKEDLLKIFLATFINPISGLADYYQNKAKNGYIGSIMLIAIAVILFVLVPFLGAGEFRSYIPFKNFVFIGLTPIFIVAFVAVLTFLFKSFMAKADFFKEFEMASFQTVLLSLIMIFVLIFFLIAKGFDPMSIFGRMNFIGVVYLLIVFYALLMMISIVKQTLSLEKINPVLIWYVSPAIVLLSLYLSSLIIRALL